MTTDNVFPIDAVVEIAGRKSITVRPFPFRMWPKARPLFEETLLRDAFEGKKIRSEEEAGAIVREMISGPKIATLLMEKPDPCMQLIELGIGTEAEDLRELTGMDMVRLLKTILFLNSDFLLLSALARVARAEGESPTK